MKKWFLPLLAALCVAAMPFAYASTITPLTDPIGQTGTGYRKTLARGFGVAAIGSSNLLSTDITPSAVASKFEVELSVASSTTLYYTVTSGGTTYTVALNGGTALTAGTTYNLSWTVSPAYTYNLRTSSSVTIQALVLSELSAGCAKASSGSSSGGGDATTIQGRSVASTAPGSGEVLTWSGTAWAPAAAAGGLSGITNTTPGQLQIDSGLGLTTHILGPSDQQLRALAAPGQTLTLGGGDLNGYIQIESTGAISINPHSSYSASVNGSLQFTQNDNRFRRTGTKTVTFDDGAGGAASFMIPGSAAGSQQIFGAAVAGANTIGIGPVSPGSNCTESLIVGTHPFSLSSFAGYVDKCVVIAPGDYSGGNLSYTHETTAVGWLTTPSSWFSCLYGANTSSYAHWSTVLGAGSTDDTRAGTIALGGHVAPTKDRQFVVGLGDYAVSSIGSGKGTSSMIFNGASADPPARCQIEGTAGSGASVAGSGLDLTGGSSGDNTTLGGDLRFGVAMIGSATSQSYPWSITAHSGALVPGGNQSFDVGSSTNRARKLYCQAASFFAYRSSAQTINDNTSTTVVCDTEVYDTGSNYNSSTGEFTAPVAGLYHFDAAASFTLAPVTSAGMQIVNSTTGKEWRRQWMPTSTDISSCGADVQCAAGDVVIFKVFHVSAASRNLDGAAGAYMQVSFSGHLIAGQ